MKRAKLVTFSFQIWVSPTVEDVVGLAEKEAREEGINTSTCDVKIEEVVIDDDQHLAGE